MEAISDDANKKIGLRSFYALREQCCPFIKTMKRASDLCGTCEGNASQISLLRNAEEREKFIGIAMEHLQEVKLQREFYQMGGLNQDNSTIIIAFDFAQNLS